VPLSSVAPPAKRVVVLISAGYSVNEIKELLPVGCLVRVIERTVSKLNSRSRTIGILGKQTVKIGVRYSGIHSGGLVKTVDSGVEFEV